MIDCVAGGGAVIRGHTPEDLVPEVIECHDKDIDYWSALQTQLAELTGLPHAFPAISGTSAVEFALSLALLANKEKTQIVTFNENYGGKTLLSLVITADDMMQAPFSPLYHDMAYIDPFAENAEEQLTATLTSGKVALVWFEIYQGGTEREIPGELLEIIARHKEEYDYLVGTDEILMSFYRLGKLFSHTDTQIKPDIMPLAKALCDGTFPMAATLVSDEVYQRARYANPHAVSYYETVYRNQLGAHIGLHCIEKLLTPGLEDHAKRIANILQQGFAEIQENSPFLKDVEGRGLSYRLHYTTDHPIVMFFWNFLYLTQAHSFLFFDRCGPPALTLTEDEAKRLMKNFQKLFYRGKIRTYFQLFLYLLKGILLLLLWHIR